jgi:predicted metal-dependent peptidase
MDNPEFEDIIYDGPGNKELSKEEIEEIKGIVVAAQTQSKLAGRASGEIPTEVARNIDELINPVIPWRILLYKFMNNRSKDLFSWSRRNRRYSEYLPSLYSENLSHLYFAIDTSGSVSKDELIELLSEIKSIKDTFNPSKMTIIDCDSHIHNVHEIDANTDILSLKFNGGGGTRFTPVLEYLEDKQPEALIYFTDLYGENSLNPVNYPILWICNSEHPPMNIGETIYFK